MSAETTVAIVLDSSFGDRLRALPASRAVWIIDTPPNRGVVQELWAGEEARPITTFVSPEGEASDEALIRILPTVDLHHGEFSQTPPYDAVEVFGAAPTPSIRQRLAEQRLTVVANEGTWFLARRMRAAVGGR